MADLIPPHGGLTEPVNCAVPTSESNDFRKRAAELKRVPISDADLSSLYRLGDGGLSPLVGPMDRTAFNRVLDDEMPGRFPSHFRLIRHLRSRSKSASRSR
jgi:sulfate adenylyltransferase